MKISTLLVLTLLGITASSSYGQWTSNTSVNTTVCVTAKTQQNTHSVTDAKNGVIVGWDDNRNNLTNSTDIYAQRLNSDGIAKWTPNGVAVCTNSFTQRSVAVTEDGLGGAILTWEDNRSGNYDIYAQKIDSSGNAVWATNGVIISNGVTNQKNPKLINDNSGGAFIVWEDSANVYFDIYAQHINAAGTVLWATNGIAICSSPFTQNNPKIDIDGLGGTIITWQDKRSGIDYDIYAQRVDASGTILWTANGVAVCTAANTQNNPRIEPDGSNGAIIAWTDKRSGIDNDIYVQRLNPSGVPQWTANGLVVCNSTSNQSALDIKYLGPTGVALSWKDQRSGSFDIYTQIISMAGTNVLAANGIKVSNALKSLNPNNIADGFGGVIVAWEDSIATAGWNITSQKISAAGTIQWSAGGVVVSNAANDQINVSQVLDGFGGAIYVWEDRRSTTDYDVYAQHIYSNGSTVGINDFNSLSNPISIYPNPVSEIAHIKLNSVSKSNLVISVYDSFGRIIKVTEIKNTSDIALDFSGFQQGLYHYILSDSDNSKVYKGTFILQN